MKKHRFRKWAVVSVLLGILLVIGTTQIFANPDTTVSIPDAVADPGGTITVPINITDVTDLGAATIWLSYNKDVVIVDSVANGNLGGLTVGTNNTTGVTKMVWFSATGQTGDFIFANVTLQAVGNPGDTSNLTLDVISLRDSGDNPIDHIVDDGLFTIRALMEGDTSLNDCVTVSDAMLIAQHLVGLVTLSDDQLESADTTDDNLWSPPTPGVGGDPLLEDRVTISDAMHIAQWLVDPDGGLGVLFKPLWESPADDDMLQPQP